MNRVNPWRLLLSAAIAAACLSSCAIAVDAKAPELLGVGRAPLDAEFQGVDDAGKLKFLSVAGADVVLAPEELVRWSTPSPARAADELQLLDGSQLGLASSWNDETSIRLDRERGQAKANVLGEMAFARASLRAVRWGLPPDAARRLELATQLASAAREAEDVVMLDNGDTVSGSVVRIDQKESTAVSRPDVEPIERPQPCVQLLHQGVVLQLPMARVRGVVLSSKADAGQSADKPAIGRLIVGLRDGSRIVANSLSADGAKLVIGNDSLAESPRVDLRDVTYLQTLDDRVTYLSDLEPASYRHEPYLDIPWPYRRDASVPGGALTVGGRQFTKGLGMHSESRLNFMLDGSHARFAATVAVDDAAGGQGSVIFRVVLRQNEKLVETFASPVMRGGDEPQPVAVDIAGASEISLVVDYADRGDELDHANWLDARLESP